MLNKLIFWKKKLEADESCGITFFEYLLLDEVHERSFCMDIILGSLK